MKKECKKECKPCKCKGNEPIKVQLPLGIDMPEIPSRVEIGEHQGRIEVVFQYRGQRIRLLGDKDGIHVGSLWNDVTPEPKTTPVPVKAKAKRVL